MSERQKRKETAILEVLRTASKPMSGPRIAAEMAERGQDVSERTVRLYLSDLDSRGLTVRQGKRGRAITEAGLEELNASSALERVGFLSARIDQMTYSMDFDLPARSGMLVVNMTVVTPQRMAACLDQICEVFAQGRAMGRLVHLAGPGFRMGNRVVPQGCVGFCTVCSITLNGVLLKHGIPMRSRFGGLLELQNNKATRFVEMITYDGSSIDPLEIFIRSGMTDYLGAITSGNGRIGASFREIPADSRDLVIMLTDQLDRIGLGAIQRIGYGGRPLLGVPVNEGRSGIIVIGGLNPAAIFEETGHRVESRALAGLIEFGQLYPYTELRSELARYL